MIEPNNKQLEVRPLIPINLHFFDAGEKTEKATPRKQKKARSEGQVAKSQEVSTAFLLVAVFFSIQFFASGMFRKMLEIYNYNLGLISNLETIYETVYMSNYIAYMFLQCILVALPIMIVSLAIGIIANLLQVGWHPTLKPLRPKFSKLNPIKGFKRIFSMRAIVDLFKSLTKFGVILYVIYRVVRNEIEKIPTLMHLTVMEGVTFIGSLVRTLGLDIGILFIFIALLDYSYQRYKHFKDLRMSKQEVKEEYKQTEGNPQIKGKIRQKMREVSMRRMMSEVPKADVIITNPTHYAVALKYDRDSNLAPVLVAKGVDYLARRIREAAKENDVEIVENPHLARTLYSNVEIGQEIPEDLYQAVAEILAYIYKTKGTI